MSHLLPRGCPSTNMAVPPSEISDELGTRYVLSRSYPTSWLSGIVWHLYARHEDN